MKHSFMTVVLLLWSSLGLANEPLKIFQSDSLAEITSEYEGRPFILMLWSIDCPPCLKELTNIQKLENELAPLEIVYISTDGIEHSAEIKRILKSFQLEDREHWVFDDVMPEKLRYSIDPNWYGELPRSYFYDGTLKRTAHSGILSTDNLKQWVTNNGFYKRVSRLNGIWNIRGNEFY